MNAESFKPILKHPGLPHSIRMHGLRITCAAVLLKIGQHLKYVQELLGYTTSITLDTSCATRRR